MLRYVIMALLAAISTSGTAEREQIIEHYESGLPLPAASMQAFDTMMKGESLEVDICRDQPCFTDFGGEFLLLDLSAWPQWRMITSYRQLTHPELLGIYAYLPFDNAKRETSEYQTLRQGVVFALDQVPGAVPGPLKPFTLPTTNGSFQFQMQEYRLSQEPNCHRVNDGFYGDSALSISHGGNTQRIIAGLKGRDPGAIHVSCESAKAEYSVPISFDFAGDLDGDGKLDLVLDNVGEGSSYQLFLSRNAPEGQVFRVLYLYVGC